MWPLQLCGATKNAAKLREIYPKTLNLDAAVADPRIMGCVQSRTLLCFMC
jgi:COP9 signalosome complex subunit 2